MLHHQDSNWGLVMSLDRAMEARKGVRGGKAFPGHADMMPRALATFAMGRKEQGWGREAAGVLGVNRVAGTGPLALTSCF